MLTLTCVTIVVLTFGFIMEVLVGASSSSFDAQLGIDSRDLEATRMSPREFLGRPAALLLAALALALAAAGQTASLAPASLAALLFLTAPSRADAPGAAS